MELLTLVYWIGGFFGFLLVLGIIRGILYMDAVFVDGKLAAKVKSGLGSEKLKELEKKALLSVRAVRRSGGEEVGIFYVTESGKKLFELSIFPEFFGLVSPEKIVSALSGTDPGKVKKEVVGRRIIWTDGAYSAVVEFESSEPMVVYEREPCNAAGEFSSGYTMGYTVGKMHSIR